MSSRDSAPSTTPVRVTTTAAGSVTMPQPAALPPWETKLTLSVVAKVPSVLAVKAPAEA